MDNERRILLINVIDFSVLVIILIYFLSGASSLALYDLVFHLIFLFIVVFFSFVVLYCAYTGKTIPYKNKKLEARQLTITLGVLMIIILVNNLIFYTEGSRYNILIRTALGADIIVIIVLYIILGVISIVSGILFKEKK